MAESTHFRRVPVYPSHAEMLNTRNFYLQKNIINGPFSSINQYLGTHFNLLREDFLSALRGGLRQYLRRKETSNIDIYKNVTISLPLKGQPTVELEPSLNMTNLKESKKFLNGSLLIFTRDNFRTSFFAKVVDRDNADVNGNQIFIEFVDSSYIGRNYVMAECRCFFEPYYQVLSALKEITESEFPMPKYIIQVKNETCLPKYLSKNASYKIGAYSFPARDWSRFPSKITGLNDSQLEAFKAALSQELAVIQGPPGTGKTYLGLKVVQVLLENSKFWYRRSPILIISHKNHALDQFLEGLLPLTKRIVRVGGQSKSEALDNYNLANLKEKKQLEDLMDGLTLRDALRLESQENDLDILQKALVVGMTTTAAARLRHVLRALQSPIAIVEEAAEVLEAHVIAALTASCQHLILLGDHFQLQPSTSDREIGKKYHLGVSLFERMVNNGIQCHKLSVQHRMRPEISKILKRTTYPFLEDHISVFDKPPILGVDQNVFFLDHTNPETTVNGTSKKNSHEAKFVVALAKYLIQNGYQSSDVTILATYMGQVQEIRREIHRMNCKEWLTGVTISTLDAFQGQESEIIILSLVRSTDIGFISAQNRICVAMSRAKNGFYMIGNMKLLSSKSEVWRTIKQCLVEDKAIGSHLTLKCGKHPKMIAQVGSAAHFDKVPCGGCTKICGGTLACGHACPLSCHILEHDKYLYQCVEKCRKRVCKIHQSKCTRSCQEICDNCQVKVFKQFECGHRVAVSCATRYCTKCSAEELTSSE